MQCITVFPILKKTFREELMYWTREQCSVGDVILIPIQNRKVWAVVSHVASVHEVKEFIKSQSFSIKKIDTVQKTDVFSREFIVAVLETARYFARSFGDIFSEFVPKKVLEELQSGHTSNTLESKENDTKNQNTVEDIQNLPTYTQKPLHLRLEELLKIQNAHTAHIITPIKTYTAYLKKDIGLHAYMPIDIYKLDQLDPSKTVCILELASSAYYRHMRKDFDMRFFIKEFCRRKNIHLIESDTVLPPDIQTSEKHNHLPKKPDVHIVQMSESGPAKTKTKDGLKKKEVMFSPELMSLLNHCQKHNESILLYVVRKGFSHQTICADCHTPVSCPTCHKPLHLTKDKHFICATCGTNETSNRACAVCGGWNLVPFGVTTEQVSERLKDLFDMPIHIIDSDHQTKSKARKKIQEKSGIYVGTELLLTQSYGVTYTYSAIISLETILAIPDAYAELKAMQVVYTLLERTESNMLIQARSQDIGLWQALEKKDWQIGTDTLKQQLKDLSLPPYATTIQIQAKEYELKKIHTYLQTYTVSPLSISQIGQTLHITLQTMDWRQSPLQRYIQSLPTHIRVSIDKTSFL